MFPSGTSHAAAYLMQHLGNQSTANQNHNNINNNTNNNNQHIISTNNELFTSFPLTISISGQHHQPQQHNCSTTTANGSGGGIQNNVGWTFGNQRQMCIEQISSTSFESCAQQQAASVQQQQQQLLVVNDNSIPVVQLSPDNSNDNNLEQAISRLLISNRLRSHSVGGIPTSNSLGFSSPNHSPSHSNNHNNNNHNYTNTTSSPPHHHHNHQQLSTSLPNQPFIVRSDYKVSSSIVAQDNNHCVVPNMNQQQQQTPPPPQTNIMAGFHQILNEIFNTTATANSREQFNNSCQTNFNQQAPPPTIIVDQPSSTHHQQQQFNNIQTTGGTTTQQNNGGFVIHSQIPSLNNHSFQNGQIQLNKNLLTCPNNGQSTVTADQQQFNNHVAMKSCSPVSICQAGSCGATAANQSCAINVVGQSNHTSGKQRRQRSLSSSSSSSGSLPYTPPIMSHQFVSNSTAASQYENQDTSPRKNKKSIKFQVEWTNDAQKFEHKHTNFTPLSMKKHIADKDERERSGSKRRGRPKGSGTKPQVKSGDLLFYQNCYNSVGDLYNRGAGGEPPFPTMEDEEDDQHM